MITMATFLTTWLTSRVRDERAASLVEYALLVAFIALACVTALTYLGNQTSAGVEGGVSILQ